METVRLLAKEFETSLTATAIRFVEECGQTCVVVMSRNGQVEWAKGTEGYKGPQIDRGQQLSPESLAYHCTTGDQLSPWQQVPATAWLENGNDVTRWEILEQSLRFRDYPCVLTLLLLIEKEEEPEDSADRFSRWHKRD